MFRKSTQAICIIFCMVFSTQAFAESVVLLATDGEGDEKTAVDRVLVEVLNAHPGSEIKETRKIGINDLIFGAGCEQPDEACMENLKGLIESDRLVFASTGAKSYSVNIYDFNEKRFVGSLDSSTFSDEAELTTQIQSVVYGKVGELFVDVGPGNAEIFIDGETFGISPQNLTGLALGKHTVSVRGPDGQEETKEVVLELGKVEKVSFTIQAPAPKETPQIVKMLPGIGVLTLGVAAVAFGATQSLAVQDFNDRLADIEGSNLIFDDKVIDEDEEDLVPAEWHQVHEEENASNASTLQWVGYGVGALGIGLGTYLIFNAMDSTEVAISPDPTRPSANVKIRF